jgi:hypothetical protein
MRARTLALVWALLLCGGCASGKFYTPSDESETARFDCGYSAERLDACFT